MDESLVAPELRPIVRRYPFKLLEYRWARQLTRILVNFIPPVRIEGVTIEPIKGIPRPSGPMVACSGSLAAAM